MFDDIPDNYRAQTADNEEEGWRYTQGDKAARRPPELLTRDHVSRCIMREVKAGRGSPHGGVFLDIAWIKARVPNGAEHIKKKLPSMYHQFKQLADIDITAGADGGRPDDALHHGRRAGGRRHADVDACPACLPRASARPASTAPIGSAATRSPTSSCSASAPASTRRSTPRRRRAPAGRRAGRSTRRRDARSSRSSAARQGEGPYQVQYALQEMMQDLVGIVQERAGDAARARRPGASCASGRGRVGVGGHREYNPGWHAALDLHNLLTVSEAITRSAHRTQGEPRRPFPRRLSRTRTPASRTFNFVVRKAPRRRDGSRRARRFPRCRTS